MSDEKTTHKTKMVEVEIVRILNKFVLARLKNSKRLDDYRLFEPNSEYEIGQIVLLSEKDYKQSKKPQNWSSDLRPLLPTLEDVVINLWNEGLVSREVATPQTRSLAVGLGRKYNISSEVILRIVKK